MFPAEGVVYKIQIVKISIVDGGVYAILLNKVNNQQNKIRENEVTYVLSP